MSAEAVVYPTDSDLSQRRESLLSELSRLSVRGLSADAFVLVFITLCMASYPYLAAVGASLFGFVALALGLVLFQRYGVKRLAAQHCPRVQKAIQCTAYIILLTAAWFLYERYGLRHPLTINGVVVLIGWLKFCDGQPYRDASGVLLIATVLFSESMISGYHYPSYLALCLGLILASLITVNNGNLRVVSWVFMSTGVRLFLLSLPLLIILYIFFPRLPGALFPWQVEGVNGWFDTQAESFKRSGQLKDVGKGAKSGKGGAKSLGETLRLDQLSDMGKSEKTVFTVEFEGEAPSVDQLYWRGGVFYQYDGSTWFQRKHWKRSQRVFVSSWVKDRAPRTKYKAKVLAHDKHWLYGLEFPMRRPLGTLVTRDSQLISPKRVNKVFEYEMEGVLAPLLAPRRKLLNYERQAALFYPQGSNARIRELGESLQGTSVYDVTDEALRIFGEGGYTYDINRFPKKGRNSLDDFMFDSKVGQCGHYASAFVLLVRAAGFPARLVTGFRGGRPLGATAQNTLEVTAMMAHAWAEVWIGTGWLRVDPTAFILGQSSDVIPANGEPYSTPKSEMPSAQPTQNHSLLSAVKTYFDEAIDLGLHYYNTQLQKQLLSFFGAGELKGRQLLMLSVGLVLLLWLLMGRLLRFGLSAKAQNPVNECYGALQQKLQQAGLPLDPYEGPMDYMHRACLVFPRYKGDIESLCLGLMALKYSAQRDGKPLAVLRRELRALTIESN